MKPIARLLAASLLLAATVATAADVPAPPAVTAPADPHDPAAFAAVGARMVRDGRLDRLGWTEAQITGFLDGVRAALHGQEVPAGPAAQSLANELAAQIQQVRSREHPVAPDRPDQLEAYLRQMQKRYLLQRSASGLCYQVDVGDYGGVRPTLRDVVVLTLSCVGPDGKTKLPQLSQERARIKVSDMLPGLAEGLQMMTIESHARFIVPPKLSFGDGPWPDGVAPGSPLLFTVVLHEVISPDAPP